MSYVVENSRVVRGLWWALAVLLALAVSGSSAQMASASWGGLDPSFAEGGFRIDPFGRVGAESAALDARGRLVVAGPGALAGTITLVRYEADGSLDPSFGAGGVATFQVSAGTEPSAGVVGMYIEQGGDIVVAGNASGREPGEGIVLRVKRKGSGLDATFGVGGIAAVPDEGVVRGLAESEGGKPVVTGQTYPEEVPLVVRLTNAGAPDPSFGSAGEVKTELPEKRRAFRAVVVDGEEITAAASFGFRAIYLARYDSAGELLSDFGQEGIATIKLPEEKPREEKKCPEGERCPEEKPQPKEEPFADINELTDLSGGRLLLTGGYNRSALIAETQPDGSLDPTFGGGGMVRPRFHDQAPESEPERGRSDALSAVVEPDGHVVIAGVGYGVNGRCESPGGCYKSTTDHLALARYSSAGKLDETFGEGGIARYLFGLEEVARFQVGKALLDQQGRLLVAGSANGDYLAARFLLKEEEFHPEESWIQEPPRQHASPEEPATCVVPNLKGKTPRRARRLLGQAGCQLGQVVRRPAGSGGASSVHAQRVYVVARSKPAAGRTIPVGEAVRLILVSRGKTG